MPAPKHLQSPIDKYGDLSTLFGIVSGMLLAKGATEHEMHEALGMLIRMTKDPRNEQAFQSIDRNLESNMLKLQVPKPE